MTIISLISLIGAAAAESPVPAPQPMVLLQSWSTVYDQDTSTVADAGGYGDPELDTGLSIRRARAGFEGSDDIFKYGVVFGFSSPYDTMSGESDESIGLVDAYGGYQFLGSSWVIVGVQKVPVSREMLTSAGDVGLGERSVATNWVAPGRDAGAVMDSTIDFEPVSVRIRTGGFNGNGSALGDTDAGKMFAARLEADIGDADTYQTYGVVDGFTLGVAGDYWQNEALATTTTGYGADLIVRVGGLAVMAEGRMLTIAPAGSDLDLPGVLSETPRMGAMAQIGYTVKAFEPIVRVSTFDDHRDVEDSGDVLEGMGGLTWHSEGDVIRAGGGYVHRRENGGAPLDNDSARMWLQLKI